MIPGSCALNVPSGTWRDARRDLVTDFRRRLAVVLLSHAIAYAGLQLVMPLIDPLALVSDGSVAVDQTGAPIISVMGVVAVALPLAWLVLGVRAAVADVHAILTDRRTRRRVATVDYLPGAARTDVNRAA
jgi:hypothetical protein